jgi:predicted cupin superfamily sugar epimerase
MHPRATTLIRELELTPHPEGGHYREIFRSDRRVGADGGRGERSGLTVIHFLLASGEHSDWHRVSSDEAWHLVEGGPLELLVIDAACEHLTRYVLASAGEHSSPVAVVPAGCWQAARPLGAFALAGCTVGPGFEFDDFDMLPDDPAAEAMIRDRWPDHVARD